MTAPVQPGRRSRFALLIDAENVPPAFAAALVDDAAGHGELAIRRAYGNFSLDCMRNWGEACPRLGIRAHQVFPGARGKNAADLALAIDAMDLLHTGGVEGFCLVSSDGDFSHLALRLREHGVMVIGYGEHKAPESFRQACGRFVELVSAAPVLVPVTQVAAKLVPATPVAAKPVAAKPSLAKPSLAKPSAETARRLLLEAHRNCTKATDGWVNGSHLRSEVGKIEEKFALTTYGHGSFRKFIGWTNGFDIRDDGVMLVRPRQG